MDVGELGIVGVSWRQCRRDVTPVDGEHGIVPENAVFVGWCVVITAFVKKLNGFG